MQKPVQPVPGKFRDDDGVHERRDDSDECGVQALVKHGCFSFHFFLAATGAEHDTAAEMTYAVRTRYSSDKARQAGIVERCRIMSREAVFLAG